MNNKINTVLEHLLSTIKVYEKASQRVHNEPMTKQYLVLAKRKRALLEKICRLQQVEISELDLSLSESIRLEFEKLGIELDHLILTRNEKEILTFLVGREKELISIYKSVLSDPETDRIMQGLLARNLKDSIELKGKMEQTKLANEMAYEGQLAD